MLDPRGVAWPQSLVSLLTLSEVAHITARDVEARLIVENLKIIENELVTSVPALTEKERVLGDLFEQKRTQEGCVANATNPNDREREKKCLEDLMIKVDGCLAIAKSLWQTVRDHRAKVDWYQTTYLKTAPEQEASAMEVAEAGAEAGTTAETTERARQATPPPPGTEQIQEAAEETSFVNVTGQGDGTSDEAPPPPASTEGGATRSLDSMEVAGEDDVTLRVNPEDDDLLDGDDIGDDSPTPSQEEQALPEGEAVQISPGVSTDMADLTVSTEASDTSQAL